MGTKAQILKADHANDDTYISGSSIEAFYAESVVLVTGATGFVGKALLEKLLRSCPRLAAIFILIRPKRNQTTEERYKSLLQSTVFDRLRVDNPGAFDKIHPVEGDVTLPNLGLSEKDMITLTQRVNIVFHSAATVRFNEPLKVAVNLNTKGTDRIIELCKRIENLVSVVHVSTAYSNANLREVKELVYPTKVKPSTVIDMCESLDDESLGVLENKILENHPNTYTFTKNLAEQIIQAKASHLPIAIVRPSIVCAAMAEPFPGWVDNTCGITGVLAAIGKGAVRSILCNSQLKVNIIPIDYVVDTLICASWHSTMQQNNAIKIYNCTNCKSPIQWGIFTRCVQQHFIETPTKYLMWYPGVVFTTNKFLYNLMLATLHYFPAFVVDFFLRIIGNKPIMMKLAKKIKHVNYNGAFFTMHEWKFDISNMDDLAQKVKALKDYSNFNIDMGSFNWETYVRCYTLGIRKYVLNDNIESLNNARSRLVWFYWVHRLTQVSSIIMLLVMIKRIGH